MTVLTLAILTLVVGGGATISAILGGGGGILVLAVLLQVFGPAVAIPLHGVIQLVANLWRGFLYREHTLWSIVGALILGAIPGIILGTLAQRYVPEQVIQVALGLFVVVATLWPIKEDSESNGIDDRWLWPLGGASGFLAMIIGSVGPLLSVYFLRRGLEPMQLVATKTWCQTGLHAMKVAGFLTLGFSFSEHALTLSAVIPAALLGTWLGRNVLKKLKTETFVLALRILLVLLGARIVWQGVVNITG